MNAVVQIFDRALLRRRRDRAVASFEGHDFLTREVARRLSERLLDVNRRFTHALDLGCHTGGTAITVSELCSIDAFLCCDLSERMARSTEMPSVVADEEALPFADGAFDLVLSNLSLHWVNDLPGTLLQIRHALRPDGLFLAAMLGGDSLGELRECLMEAEIEIRGGASPRVAPFTELRDAGALLQRAGFALPVVDADSITVTYADPFRLFADLRGMGAANALHERSRRFMRRDMLFRAAELYRLRHGARDGRIPATFRVIYLHGWAPHASQQKPLRRGSAAHRLADALDTQEHRIGPAAQPRPQAVEDR